MCRVRYARRVGGELPLEHEDLPTFEMFAQMVVRAAIAEPQLEDWTLQRGDHSGRRVDTGSLRLQAPDETVEAAHNEARGSAWPGLGLAQLRGRLLQTMGEDPHDLHPHLGKVGDHTEE